MPKVSLSLPYLLAYLTNSQYPQYRRPEAPGQFPLLLLIDQQLQNTPEAYKKLTTRYRRGALLT